MKIEIIKEDINFGGFVSEIDITEKEFDAFLKTDESLAELEPELLVRQILVTTIEEANKAITRINLGEDFSSLAKEVSKSRNSQNGGLMDWRKLFEMPDLFSTELKNKKLGYVSNPLKSGAGYHILKLEDKRGPYVQYEEQWLARHILLSSSSADSNTNTNESSPLNR